MEQGQETVCCIGTIVVNVEGVVVKDIWEHHSFGQANTDRVFENRSVGYITQWLLLIHWFSIQILRNTTTNLSRNH